SLVLTIRRRPPTSTLFPYTTLFRSCHQSGDEWKVLSEVLLYRFLVLPSETRALVRDSGNNRSCVVQVQWYDQRFLLTGDSSVDVEQQLVRRYGDERKSGVLGSGHHGSQTDLHWRFYNPSHPPKCGTPPALIPASGIRRRWCWSGWRSCRFPGATPLPPGR